MTIHFFTYSNKMAGSSRHRAFLIAEELRAVGINTLVHWPPTVLVSVTPWPQKLSLILAIIRALFLIKKGDIVYLQRTVSNKYFFVIMVVYLKLFRRKMIFDFDDAIYMNDFFKTKLFTKMADAVIVCSRALALWAKKYNKNVYVIHTSLKFAVYEKFTKDNSASKAPCVIGWVGAAPEHIRNLEILASVFRKLLAKTKIPFKFVLVGAMNDKKIYDVFLGIRGLSTEFIDRLDWSNSESVPREIQKFDIGVMPLAVDDEWNNARSSFKPFEYMACGVATMCSAVGEIKNVIEDGVNGYLASTEEEWVKKLGQLMVDERLRMSLGKAGQKSIREEECYEVYIPKLVTIFENL